MNRRSFFKLFAAGVGALCVAPKILIEEVKKKFKVRRIKPVGKWKHKEYQQITSNKLWSYYNKRKEYNRHMNYEDLRRNI